jgi:hypothetical protein
LIEERIRQAAMAANCEGVLASERFSFHCDQIAKHGFGFGVLLLAH